MPDYYRRRKTGISKRLAVLAAEGELVRARVEGLDGPAYIYRDNLGRLEEVLSGGRQPALMTLLSPFDPPVRDRQRARDLFDFDDTIEC